MNRNRLIATTLLLLAFSASLGAQQLTASLADLPDAPMPQAPASSSSTQQQVAPDTSQETEAQRHARADKQIEQEEHQRIAGVLPAFNSVQNGTAVPLTPDEKFHLFFRGSVDPYQFVLAGINAGIEQAENTYPEYHQGFPGYARRYAASYADTFDGNFWGNAVLPSLLHQDPRYYRLGHASGKSGWHRFFYAASTTVIAHGDNGKLEPNVSNVLGNFIGGAISNLYYPASNRGVGHTIDNGITTTAEGIIGAELIEFYPDFVSWRQHRHERKLASRATSNSESTP